jgi:hypothetical protein
MATIFEIDNNSGDESIEITLRGKPDAVIAALATGLPREALMQFKEAMESELAKRRDEASVVGK